MRRRIHFHGPLGKICPYPVEVVADTVWDALEGVSRQIKGFAPTALTGRRTVQVAGFPSVESLRSPTDIEDIHVFPSMQFGKNGGVITTIVGVFLIVASFLLPIPPNFKAALLNVGLAMIVGGAIQMLTPAPQLNGSDDDQLRSKYLPGISNTVRIGTTIPLLYGRRRCGGQILSLNIDSKDATL